MKLVVDTSVLLAVVANEPGKAQAVAMTTGAELIAPHSVHWEVGNALIAGLRRRRFDVDLVIAAWRAYEQIPIRFVPISVVEALRLADSLRIYAYDAYVLCCARAERCSLLTLDRSMMRAAKRERIPTLDL